MRAGRHLDALLDLDVGAVVRADDQPTVHHELHVGRARGLRAGRRDVLGDVVRRDDHLSDRHVE